jgi:hypothetical protein
MSDILVIGGGAAGMMAAVFAARAGGNVTLLEKNEKLGKKVYITGKGRCNLTNDCSLDEFLAQVPRNPRFLYSALSFFPPRDMMALLEQSGCPVTVQRGKRVFPSSEKASDVTKALASLLRSGNVRIRLNTEVRSLSFADGLVTGVVLSDGAKLSADAVIIACGGLSYPSTGSTGDGYRLAESAGHTLVPPQPVLVGLETVETWPQSLQGLSLRNVTLTLSSGKKALWSELGEMLFTHYGVSGPLVLEASCHLPDPAGGARLLLDLKPGLSREQLDARLRRDFTEAGKKMLKSVLPGLLPASFAEIFPALCGLDASLPCSQITAAQRGILLDRLKALPLTVKAPRPVDEAVVTRGGVSVKEIEPKTMRSKLIPNLFFAGEMIDVDAHTGGFNLQIAWSTGALAGRSSVDCQWQESRQS